MEVEKINIGEGKPPFQLFPYDDYAVLLQWNCGISVVNNQLIQAYSAFLLQQPEVKSTIPAYDSMMVIFHHNINRINNLKKKLLLWYSQNPQSQKINSVLHKIPVCYHDDFGLDLAYVAQYHKLSINEVISLHTNTTYHVQMIGFLPGFPYLAGLSKRLETPRRSTPRKRVLAGSIGIGNTQTGIYPISSPGGWHIIGRTPIDIFSPKSNNPFLIKGGDKIRFHAITMTEYQNLLQLKDR